MGIIAALALIGISASSGDGEKALLGIFVLVFYIVLLAIFFPMFKSSYKIDKDNLNKTK